MALYALNVKHVQVAEKAQESNDAKASLSSPSYVIQPFANFRETELTFVGDGKDSRETGHIESCRCTGTVIPRLANWQQND